MRGARVTPREHEVLDRVCRGEANKTIAIDLGMSEQGAKAHVSKLFLKFGVTNRASLAAAAMREHDASRGRAAAGREHQLRRANGRLVRANRGLRLEVGRYRLAARRAGGLAPLRP